VFICQSYNTKSICEIHPVCLFSRYTNCLLDLKQNHEISSLQCTQAYKTGLGLEVKYFVMFDIVLFCLLHSYAVCSGSFNDVVLLSFVESIEDEM